MIGAVPQIRLLIAEDDLEWQELLQGWFSVEAKTQGLNLEIEVAETVQEVERALRLRQYHAVSLDQNFSDSSGGDVAAEHGQRLAQSVSRNGVPVFAAMYTGFPNIDITNKIGATTGIPYKIKATVSDEHSLEPDDYAKWFLTEFKKTYVAKILKRVDGSGFSDLAECSRLALDEHNTALASRQDADITRYMNRINSLREEFLRNLVILTAGFMRLGGQTLDGNPDFNVADKVESWLKKHWDLLEQDETFSNWKSFMGVDDGETMSQYFLNPMMEMRLERNRVVHDQKINYTHDSYLKLYPSIIRLMDMLTYFITRRMINKPYFVRPGILSYIEMRGAFPEPIEMQYKGDLPDDDTSLVYTRLVEGGPLVSLSPGYTCKYDDKNRLQLVSNLD